MWDKCINAARMRFLGRKRGVAKGRLLVLELSGTVAVLDAPRTGRFRWAETLLEGL